MAATGARDAAKDIALGTGEPGWVGSFRRHHALVREKAGRRRSVIAYLASDQSRQAADDITHADLAGVLRGGVYANGIAWFVEPDADMAIAFVQEAMFPRSTSAQRKVTKAYVGSTEVDRIYVGSTRVF